MLLFVVALQAEAAPIIAALSLHKDMAPSAFPVYVGPDAALTVSGVGKVRAAMAAALLCERYRASLPSSLLVNPGICACFSDSLRAGDVRYAVKVTDQDTRRDRYPDVFPHFPLLPASLLCVSSPAERNSFPAEDEHGSDLPTLVDMESAGVLEAAAIYLFTQQVLIAKVVSDFGEPGSVTPDLAAKYIGDALPTILEAARAAESFAPEHLQPQVTGLYREAAVLMEDAADRFRFTRAMRSALDREIRLCLSLGKDPRPVLSDLSEMPPTTKRESKEIYDRLVASIRNRAVPGDLS